MRILYFLIGALLLAFPAAAQSSLSAGMTVTGQSGANYQFTAAAGDLVIVQAFGISPDFTPVLTLLNPYQQQVAQAQDDPTAPGTTTLAYRVPADGLYTLAVSGLYGASGQFVLTLTSSPASAAPALTPGDNSLQIGTTAQVYQFSGPAEIMISAASLMFSAEVRDASGQLVSELNGVPQAAFALDSGGTFQMTISATSSGQVNVQYTPRPDLATTEPPTVEITAQAAATEQATEAATEAATAAPTITPTALPPTITPTPSSTPIPTSTLVPTATLPPTATPAPSATPTSTPIPVTTEPAVATLTPAPAQTENVQIAPRDNSYPVTITLGNAFTASDVVSYPKGDQEDTVYYVVKGLSSNASADNGKAALNITALCNGTGTEFITITVGRQTYHCGDVIVDSTVTNATRSGTIRISATGGDATYVQWELIGSAAPIQSGG